MRSFLALILFVGACMIEVVSVWPNQQVLLTTSAETARLLVYLLGGIMSMGGALLMPGLAAVNMAAEREQDTYDQLRLTLIQPFGIVLGKLLNVLGFYLLLCMAVLPVFGVVFFLVGVDWIEFATLVLVVGGVVTTTTAIGVCCGAVYGRTVTAVIYTYMFLAIVALATSLLMGLVIKINPFGKPSKAVVIIVCAGYVGTIFLLALRLAVTALRQMPRVDTAKAVKLIDDPAILEARRKRFPYYLIDPLRRKRAIGDGRNPMLARELGFGMLTRTTIMVRVFYLSLVGFTILGIVLILPGSYRSGDLPALIVKALTVETALTLLVGTALMANVFTKEREMGNVDMLRMTLLSARQIVFGKLFAGFTAVLPLLLAATIAMIPLMGIAGWSQALLVLLAGCPTLYVCVWLALCLGMYASMITRRTSTSLLFSYFLNGAALFGFILATVLWRMVVHALSGVYPGGNPDAALYFSPLFAYMGGFSGGRNGLNARTWHVSIGWMISEISFFLLGWVIVMLCILKFKYRYMRDR